MSIEIEIKALTNDLDKVQQDIESKYDMSICTKVYSEQLNHYFNRGQVSLNLLLNLDEAENTSQEVYNSKLLPYKQELLAATKLAVRTRWDSVQGTLLIFKYSLIDKNSDNGTIRKEIELEIPYTLEELDNLLLECGFTYQSKWSRKRTQYTFESGWSICCDLNAGYQGLVEVEYLATEEEYATKKDYFLYKANTFLTTLGLVELDSSLLEQMFHFYSQNFDDFYGKDKYIWDDPRFPYNRDGSAKPDIGLISNLRLDGAII